MNTQFNIIFSCIDDINEFVRITSSSSGDFDVINGRYIMDGKSIMGLISLPLNTVLFLVIKNSDERCVNMLKKYGYTSLTTGQ